jgi:ATP-dependent Lon protease
MPHNPRMPHPRNKNKGDLSDNESPKASSPPHKAAPKRPARKATSTMPKRKTRPEDDDSDVDSRGNINGLIDYEYGSDSGYGTNTEEEIEEWRRQLAGSPEQRKGPETKKKSSVTAPKKMKMAPRGRYNLRSRTRPSKQVESSTEEESAFEPDTSEEEEEEAVTTEEEVEEEDEETTDEEENSVIRIIVGGSEEQSDALVPKRHNMKKEPEAVKKFVTLITAPSEDNTIDTQIDQFKSLDETHQQQILRTLEARPATSDVKNSLMFKILQMRLQPDVQSYVLAKYKTLQGMDPSAGEYFKIRNWLEKVTAMPFGICKEMPVKLEDGHEGCGQFMERARKYLDDAVYGQQEAKIQVLQFIATKIANPESRGLSLLLVGPAGVGKTSLIKGGIAKALDWPFQFISLGGETDASTYTGHQLVYEGSHAGKIVNSLIQAKSMSMVMMFDEVDKISTTPKGEEIQNMLIHLTDPVQNSDFEDKYLANIPIDLSKAMFVFSANDESKIDRILLDRMVVVRLKGYDKKEKLQIAEQYVLPGALKEVNLTEKVKISREVIEHVIENHAGDGSGVRELKRCIEQMAQKLNMLRMYNHKDLPFHIPDFSLPFIVKKEHADLFLKKTQAEEHKPPYGMYC